MLDALEFVRTARRLFRCLPLPSELLSQFAIQALSSGKSGTLFGEDN
jgi:hypothetical protein